VATISRGNFGHLLHFAICQNDGWRVLAAFDGISWRDVKVIAEAYRVLQLALPGRYTFTVLSKIENTIRPRQRPLLRFSDDDFVMTMIGF